MRRVMHGVTVYRQNNGNVCQRDWHTDVSLMAITQDIKIGRHILSDTKMLAGFSYHMFDFLGLKYWDAWLVTKQQLCMLSDEWACADRLLSD